MVSDANKLKWKLKATSDMDEIWNHDIEVDLKILHVPRHSSLSVLGDASVLIDYIYI